MQWARQSPFFAMACCVTDTLFVVSLSLAIRQILLLCIIRRNPYILCDPRLF